MEQTKTLYEKLGEIEIKHVKQFLESHDDFSKSSDSTADQQKDILVSYQQHPIISQVIKNQFSLENITSELIGDYMTYKHGFKKLREKVNVEKHNEMIGYLNDILYWGDEFLIEQNKKSRPSIPSMLVGGGLATMAASFAYGYLAHGEYAPHIFIAGMISLVVGGLALFVCDDDYMGTIIKQAIQDAQYIDQKIQKLMG